MGASPAAGNGVLTNMEKAVFLSLPVCLAEGRRYPALQYFFDARSEAVCFIPYMVLK